VTSNGSDAGLLAPMLQAVQSYLATHPQQVLADAGFRSGTIFEHLKGHPTELIVALGREGKRHVCVDPQRRPFTAAMAGEFQQPATQQAYRRRNWLSEPPSGWVKNVLFPAIQHAGPGQGAG
jgi:hypothetical protein